MQKNFDLPLIPLRGLTVFPNTTVNFDVGRKKSVAAVTDAVKNRNGKIILCRQINTDESNPQADGIYTVGVLARVVQVISNGGETLRIIVDGIKKVKVTGYVDNPDFFVASYAPMKELHARTVEAKAYRRKCMSVVEEHYFVGERATKDVYNILNETEEPVAFLYRAAHLMDISDRQGFLEIDDVIDKYELLLDFLEDELEIAKVEKKINRKVRESIDKGQKEYYLREQIKAIQEELGDEDDDDLLLKADKLPIPEESKKKLKKDIERNAKMPTSSPDYAISRNYFDFVFDLPWGIESEDNNDIENARKILDEDHYGLEKIKERILEFLAVRQLTDEKREPGNQRSDHLSGGPAGRRQNVDCKKYRKGAQQEIRQNEPWRHPRRSGNPRASQNVRRGNAGTNNQQYSYCRHDESCVFAGRNRQTCVRLQGRSVKRAP